MNFYDVTLKNSFYVSTSVVKLIKEIAYFLWQGKIKTTLMLNSEILIERTLTSIPGINWNNSLRTFMMIKTTLMLVYFKVSYKNICLHFYFALRNMRKESCLSSILMSATLLVLQFKKIQRRFCFILNIISNVRVLAFVELKLNESRISIIPAGFWAKITKYSDDVCSV